MKKLKRIISAVVIVCLLSVAYKGNVSASDISEVVSSTSIVHNHTGDNVHGGGCYSVCITHTCNYTWNTGETTSTINVTDNKEYSCTINYRDNGVSRSTVLNYNVMDYDNIPPVINSISLNITDRTNNNVMLTPDIFDNYSGVAGFSVNGGSYITGSYEATSNGLNSIKAKDACDNETTSTFDITISNIDKEAPVVNNVTLN